MRKLFATIGWVAIVAASAEARDFYVDNVAGDDLFNGVSPTSGGSESGPCRTIARALRIARKGDRIILAKTNRPYCESITLQAGRHSGVASRPFEIVGNGATLEGALPVPHLAWEHVLGDVYKFAPHRKSFQLLFMDDRPAERVAVKRGDVQLPALKPLQWCLFEREIYFRAEKDRTPHQYDLAYCAHTVGITLYEVRHVRISGLIVQGFQLDGINAHDGVRNVTLKDVTCRGNARSGVSVGGASQVRIEDSLLGNNGAAQLRSEGASHTRVVNSELLDNTAPSIVRDGGEVLVETGDPPDRDDPDDRRADNSVRESRIRIARRAVNSTAY